MAKLVLKPQFGTMTDSKKIKYEIEGLESLSDGEQYRIDFENTTFACEIDEEGEYLNLNIPPHSSQSAISVFANIIVIDDRGNASLKEICPAIFGIQDKVLKKFEGDIQINPVFASPKDLCNIKISSCEPNSKTIFSVNDRRFSVMSNDDGNGSIHFLGKDVLDKEATSVQKIPIHFYSKDDNYIKKNFTGSYINLLPQEIASFADAPVDPRCTDPNYVPGDWNYDDDAPTECFPDVNVPDAVGTPTTITAPVIGLPTTKHCSGDDYISIQNGCKVNNHSAAILNNGRIVHAYTNVDRLITDTDSPFYNINKVTVLDNNSSVIVPIIANRDVTIAPKTRYGNFEIYVERDLYDALGDVGDNPSAADVSVLFYDSSIGYQSAKVIGRRIDFITTIDDPSKPSGEGAYYIIIAEDESIRAKIDGWMFCVNVSFYKRTEDSKTIIRATSRINLELGYVKDPAGNVLQTNNVAIASNKKYLSTYDESFIYLVSESFKDGESHLFFASAAVGTEYENNTQDDLYFGWKQITFSGNNINPTIYADDTNTLHVFWESDRSGSWKIYYGCLGRSNEFMTNAVLAAMVDKQAELFDKDDKSSNYLSQNLLEDKSDDDPSAPIPSSVTTDLLTVTEWQDNDFNNGVVLHIGSSSSSLDNVQIFANAVNDEAISFVKIPIYDTERSPGPNNSIPYSQINYQISFDLTTSLTQPSSLLSDWNGVFLDEKDVDILFDSWKSEFVEYIDTDMSNIPAYSKDGNIFAIGRQDGIFDKIVPFCGAYDTESNPSFTNFTAKILKEDNTLKDFMFGFMFEKSRFKATNVKSSEEHESISDEDYILHEEHTIFTGRAKLIAFVKSEDDNDERANYCILREFPKVFNLMGTNSYDIVVNYTKIDSDEVENVVDSFNTSYPDRFAGRVTLFIDSDAKFSQSFVSEISYDDVNFSIGLGIPLGGYLVADKMTPSTSGLFDNVNVNMSYNNIQITSPIYSYNPDVVYLSPSVTNMTEFRVQDVEDNPSNVFAYTLLNLGIRDVETTISSIRILRCGNPGICPDGNGEWNEDFDVSNIEKLTFTIDAGTGPAKDGLVITNTDTNAEIYRLPLAATWLLPGGVFTADVSLFGHNNINITLLREFPNVAYVDLNLDFISINYENKFSQIPISMEGVCKSPSITYGTCNDAHLVWQSNLNNYWDVYYSNAVDKLKPFRFDTKITNTKSNSIMPSVSVNRNGKRMIVWHDNRNKKFDIYSARSLNGYICDEDFCKSKMVDVYEDEITQCSLSFSYTVLETGYYNFAINFYTDSGLADFFKVISSSDDSVGWFVDGVDLNVLLALSTSGNFGVQLISGDVVTISYAPNKEDGIFDKMLYVQLEDTMV